MGLLFVEELHFTTILAQIEEKLADLQERVIGLCEMNNYRPNRKC
jgi:hypothetical protein